MGKSGEFYTFDEVLKRLAIDETKLKRLVSEGEIRAFRDGGQMKFRRADVESLNLTGVPSEEETGIMSEPLTDDLIFDEGDDLDLGLTKTEDEVHDPAFEMGTLLALCVEALRDGATRKERRLARRKVLALARKARTSVRVH